MVPWLFSLGATVATTAFKMLRILMLYENHAFRENVAFLFWKRPAATSVGFERDKIRNGGVANGRKELKGKRNDCFAERNDSYVSVRSKIFL